MENILRQSAVEFTARAARTEIRDNWPVVLQYEQEGSGPWLVDLAHKVRLDLQDSNIDSRMVAGVAVPESPGKSVYTNKVLVNRMNRTQASIYLLGNEHPDLVLDHAYTDVSEATVFLTLFGPRVFSITEKLTALDFQAPGIIAPFLYQGPVCHVPCQIVTLHKGAGASGGILLSCSRGYAQSIVRAILESGDEFGLHPAGEERFSKWLEALEV